MSPVRFVVLSGMIILSLLSVASVKPLARRTQWTANKTAPEKQKQTAPDAQSLEETETESYEQKVARRDAMVKELAEIDEAVAHEVLAEEATGNMEEAEGKWILSKPGESCTTACASDGLVCNQASFQKKIEGTLDGTWEKMWGPIEAAAGFKCNWYSARKNAVDGGIAGDKSAYSPWFTAKEGKQCTPNGHFLEKYQFPKSWYPEGRPDNVRCGRCYRQNSKTAHGQQSTATTCEAQGYSWKKTERICWCEGSACNWECYLNRYPDLKNAFGSFGPDLSLKFAENHYNSAGKNEGRDCTCP